MMIMCPPQHGHGGRTPAPSRGCPTLGDNARYCRLTNVVEASLLTRATPLGGWLRTLTAKVHKNAAIVALANKLARIAWAVLRHGTMFDANAAIVMA
jgi:hypothetical protein